MKEGKEIIEFSGIMPNPTYRKVMEGVQLFKDSHAEMILGIGGGSVMDCCKAISLAARCSKDVWQNFWERKGIIDFDPVPTGVIPTTAGTGSECNGAAVITNEEKKIKTGYDYPRCNPDFALMDPAYTFSVPKEQMVSGAFDSLSHIMETYFSGPDQNNVSDDLAEALMRGIIRDLRVAVKDRKDYTARSNLFWESTLSENRLVKLGKKCDLIDIRIGSISSERIQTAIMAGGWRFCSRSITGIFTRTAFPNSQDLREMYGRSRGMEEAMKSWRWTGFRRCRILSGRSAFPPRSGNWA